jgi:hypothetical protein
MNQNRIGFDQRSPQAGQGFLARIGGAVGAVIGLVVLVAVVIVGLMVSVVIIPVALLVAACIAGYLWYKTRDIRRELRNQMQAFRESDPASRVDGFGQRTRSARGPIEQGKVIDGDDYIHESHTKDQ